MPSPKHCCEHPGFLSGLRQSTQSNFYRRQKSDPIYYRSYCAVTKADMDPLFDHDPVMFYLTGFGAKGLIYIRPKVARVWVGCLRWALVYNKMFFGEIR